MSTRGAFILARNNEYKELYIWSDAYPDYTGRDVIRLIKTIDMNRAFDHLIPCRDGKKPDGTDAMYLSLSRVEDAAGKDSELYYYRAEEQMFIYDSVSCEYGYLIDMDKERFEFYTNKPDSRQKGNRFGEEIHRIPPTGVECYPCGLRAKFSFDYIKENETADLVKLMQKIKDERPEEPLLYGI